MRLLTVFWIVATFSLVHGTEDISQQAKQEQVMKFLNWLSSDQKAEINKMITNNKTYQELNEVSLGFYYKAKGEQKELADKSLKQSCKAMLTLLIGESKFEEIRQYKKNGATNKQVFDKVDDLVKDLATTESYQKFGQWNKPCRAVYKVDE